MEALELMIDIDFSLHSHKTSPLDSHDLMLRTGRIIMIEAEASRKTPGRWRVYYGSMEGVGMYMDGIMMLRRWNV